MAGPLFIGAGSGSSGGSSATSAIAGDNQIPYSSTILGTTTSDFLTTGDLVAGEPGEMGNLTECAIEFWFQLQGAYPSSSQSMMHGPRSSTAATDQWQFNLSTTGKIIFGICDDTGVVRGGTTGGSVPAGSTFLVPVWVHLVMTAQGGSVRLYINGVQDTADAAWGAHSVRVLGAVAGSEDMRVLGPTDASRSWFFDEIAVYRHALTAARVAEHYRAGRSQGFFVQSPAERIIAALDNAGPSRAPRSIQTGTRSIIPRYMSGQAPIEEVRRAVEAEDVDAAFFCEADGTLKFLADGHRSSSPYNTSQATFGDGGGAELPYTDYKSDFSPAFLINEWNVTRSDYGTATPLTQTSSDSTSISRYFKRSQSLSDVPVTQDSDASTISTELLAKYKDPMYRVTAISPNMADGTTAQAVYNRELMDKITVKRRPPGGGSAISQDLFIQSITHSGTPGVPPSCTLGVSPL